MNFALANKGQLCNQWLYTVSIARRDMRPLSFNTAAVTPAEDPTMMEQRLLALTKVIDWAEGEAAALRLTDAGICLQLARLALQAHDKHR